MPAEAQSADFLGRPSHQLSAVPGDGHIPGDQGEKTTLIDVTGLPVEGYDPPQTIEPPTAATSAVETTCPHCRGPITGDPAFAGQQVSCPHCGGVFQMPSMPNSSFDRRTVAIHRPPPLPPQAMIPTAAPIIVYAGQPDRPRRARAPKKHPITKMLMLIATAGWLLGMVLTVGWMLVSAVATAEPGQSPGVTVAAAFFGSACFITFETLVYAAAILVLLVVHYAMKPE